MKGKSNVIWRAIVALVLMASLGMVFAMAPSATGIDGGLTVVVDAPDTGASVGQSFTVTADITNDSGDIAYNVSADIGWTGAVSWVGDTDPPRQYFGDLGIGETAHASWGFHCDDAGEASFTVEATGEYPVGYETLSGTGMDYTIQEIPAALEVEILSPDWGSPIATSQDFAVTAEVRNTGEADAIAIEVYLDTGDNASTEEPIQEIKRIPGHGKETVTWTVHCDASGATTLEVSAYGGDENSGDEIYASPDFVLVAQYPAAHLEVQDLSIEIEGEEVSEVNVCDTFTVTADIVNTGEADAWEVSATLLVDPEGSAQVVTGGYTQPVGTLAGHGSANNWKEVTWTLHCKEACNTTITVTASGYDEYGLKFTEGGVVATAGFIDNYIDFDDADVTVHAYFDGWADGYFKGIIDGYYNGYIDGYFDGYFNGYPFTGYYSDGFSGYVDGSFDGNVSGWLRANVKGHFIGDAYEGMFTGTLTGTVAEGYFYHGSADLCLDGYAEAYVYGHYAGDIDGYVNASLGGYFDGYIDGYHYTGYYLYGGWLGNVDGHYEGYISGYYSGDVDGCFKGYLETDFSGNISGSVEVVEWTRTKDPGAPIPARFIEPASDTVKQVGVAADLEVSKEADSDVVSVGSEVIFTVSLYNNGPADATGVEVTDLLPPGVSYTDDKPDQGWYDENSGVWHVGNLDYGDGVSLEIYAIVDVVGYISNIATITACDQPDPTTSNNSDMARITGVEPGPSIQEEISLSGGWQLISFPIIPNNYLTPVVLGPGRIRGPGAVNIVWGYEGQRWRSWAPVVGGRLTTMKDGLGYWINMSGVTDDTFLDIYGWEMPAPPATPPTYAVRKGWNLAGFKEIRPMSHNQYLNSIAGNYTQIFTYDPVSRRYPNIYPIGDGMLEPGLGYWLHMNAAGIIAPPGR